MGTERFSSMGELACQRVLVKTGAGYEPGQHHARIIDPRPHRDRADLAAILTYVDDEGMACAVTCLRYRDTGWRSVTLRRAGLRRLERATAANCPRLDGTLRRVVVAAAVDAAPYPFEEPSADERAMRRLAHKLLDRIEAQHSPAPPSSTEGVGDA